MENTTQKRIDAWLTQAYDQSTRDKIRGLQRERPEELEDAFYKNLEFGTGGLRGIMGVGTNRINKYTIGMATQGYANYLKKCFTNIKVAIAHDSRNNSREFAEITADVFGANGISGLSGVAYETIIETLDGFSAEYGWSWGDFSANILGSGLFTAQELAWDDQRIKLKFSFHKKNYGDAELNARADKIFGKSETERFFKDYNAATDWLSINIKSFFTESKVPPWLAIAFGYGAEGMFGARSNVAVDKSGVITFDRSDIKRYRQWYLSPDIDLTKIKTNSRGLRFLFVVLSAFKFPAPSLEFSQGNIKAHWLHF